jgi:hypothetical protein
MGAVPAGATHDASKIGIIGKSRRRQVFRSKFGVRSFAFKEDFCLRLAAKHFRSIVFATFSSDFSCKRAAANGEPH